MTATAEELLADGRIVSLVDRLLDAERRVYEIEQIPPLAAPSSPTDAALVANPAVVRARRAEQIQDARLDAQMAFEGIEQRLRLLVRQTARGGEL